MSSLIERRRALSSVKRPNYLKFTAQEDGCTLSLNKVGNPTDRPTEYAINGGSFSPYTFGTALTLDEGETVEWRRAKNANSPYFSNSQTHYYTFTASGTLTAAGLITTLLYHDGKAITIHNYAFAYLMNSPNIQAALELPDTLINIFNYAFYNCTSFKGSLIFPESVRNISECAFYYCSGFTGDLVLHESISLTGNFGRQFAGCTGLNGTLVLPQSITDIYISAFDGCKFKGELVFPESLNYIGVAAFRGSTFSSVRYKGTLEQWLNITFGSNTATPCNSTDLYINDLLLQSFNAPQGVALKPCTFCGVKSITSFSLDQGITAIPDYFFYGCIGLTGNLVIPDTITSIGESSFYGCTGFGGTLTLGSGLITIKKSAFNNCSHLTGSLAIPNSVTSIGVSAFQECSGFSGTLTIGTRVATIGISAFYKCYNLSGSLTIPDSVISIGQTAFDYTGKFTGSLILGTGLTSIAVSSLRGLSLVDNIVSLAQMPPTLNGTGNQQALPISKKTVYVPYSADHSILAAYQATNWATQAANILELDENGEIPS